MIPATQFVADLEKALKLDHFGNTLEASNRFLSYLSVIDKINALGGVNDKIEIAEEPLLLYQQAVQYVLNTVREKEELGEPIFFGYLLLGVLFAEEKLKGDDGEPDYAQAKSYYESVLAVQDVGAELKAEAYMLLGDLYAEEKLKGDDGEPDYVQAKKYYESVLAVQDLGAEKKAEGYFLLGRLYAEAKLKGEGGDPDHAQAMKYYKSALAVQDLGDEAKGWIYILLGGLYAKEKPKVTPDYQQAKDCYEAVLKLDGSNVKQKVWANIRVVELYEESKLNLSGNYPDYDRAILAFENYLKSTNDNYFHFRKKFVLYTIRKYGADDLEQVEESLRQEIISKIDNLDFFNEFYDDFFQSLLSSIKCNEIKKHLAILNVYIKLLKLRSKISSADVDESVSISHYTSLGTLEAILLKEKVDSSRDANINEKEKKTKPSFVFRKYPYFYMNDPEEGRILSQLMEQKCSRNNSNTHENPKIFLEKIFGQYDIYKNINNDASFMCLLCFNKDPDNLAAWRSYGDEARGVSITAKIDKNFFKKINVPATKEAIGVDFKNNDKTHMFSDDLSEHRFSEPRESHALTNQKSKFPFLYRVKYELNNGEDKEIAHEIVSQLSALYQCLENNGSASDGIDTEKVERVVYYLMQHVIFLFKSNDYAYEQEIRAMNIASFADILSSDKQTRPLLLDDRQHKPKKVFIETEDFLFMNDDDITWTITLGPNSDEDNLIMIKYWLAQHGLNHVNVKRSEVKYRGK